MATENKVIGVVLTQETEGKEYIITYVGRRLIDAETRYTFIEKVVFIFIPCLYQVELLFVI